MKITIIENELYLAQSISTKLNQSGYETEIFSSIKEAMTTSTGDAYLLSTNLPGQNFNPLITKYKEKIIILMVSYINNDTVAAPLKLGANDYIVKPFMIEELQRKIEHYKEFQTLKKYKNLYKEYSEYLLNDINIVDDIDKITTPVVIFTNYIKLVDKLAFKYAQNSDRVLVFVPLGAKNWRDKIENSNPKHILYISELQTLKKAERDQLFELLVRREFIISTTTDIETPYPKLEINTDNKLYDQNEILTIDDYVKFIVNSFQYQFPDTELSKKLGISRKSLWEKRKKYGIFKKK
ncbi:response regulator transcription factor [Sulfurovum sp. bin170]|uniref:response regulator n=1 Tax=Sulfurovum sp. bin170 TaxID=2695268 RepID=UPI0013DFA4E0|nr:response regulator [Sulfurovum sp. bin170]NEW60987.1 response regulator transcription factor [Sulfurovum sp. bin170]